MSVALRTIAALEVRVRNLQNDLHDLRPGQSDIDLARVYGILEASFGSLGDPDADQTYHQHSPCPRGVAAAIARHFNQMKAMST